MTELMGIARFKIHEGKLDEFLRLSAEAEEIVRAKDPGTLQYDTFFNEDRTECVIIERYRDSEAAMAHAANLADLSAKVLDTVTVVHGEVLGSRTPSSERTWPAWTSRNSSRPTARWERPRPESFTKQPRTCTRACLDASGPGAG